MRCSILLKLSLLPDSLHSPRLVLRPQKPGQLSRSDRAQAGWRGPRTRDRGFAGIRNPPDEEGAAGEGPAPSHLETLRRSPETEKESWQILVVLILTLKESLNWLHHRKSIPRTHVRLWKGQNKCPCFNDTVAEVSDCVIADKMQVLSQTGHLMNLKTTDTLASNNVFFGVPCRVAEDHLVSKNGH